MTQEKGAQKYIFELGQKIKTYRIYKGISQQELANRSGVSKRSISRLEQGDSMQLDNLFRLLIALDLSDNINLLVPDQTERPSFHLIEEAKKPQRVRRRKEVSGDFKWGDEK